MLTTLRYSYGKSGAKGKDFKIAFDLELQNATSRNMHAMLSKGEMYDSEMVKAMIDVLKPGDTFIDIGSHVGYFALMARQMIGKKGRIFAFEASPDTYAILASSIQSNEYFNIAAFNCAVSDTASPVQFSVHKTDDGQSSLGNQFFDGHTDFKQYNVACTTLDSLHSQIKFKDVRVVKIDVEGYESNVFRGGEKFFSEVLPEYIMFEINNASPGITKGYDAPIRRQFAEKGYRSYLIRPANPQAIIANWAEVEKMFGESNYLEIPASVGINISVGNILMTRRHIQAPVFGLA